MARAQEFSRNGARDAAVGGPEPGPVGAAGVGPALPVPRARCGRHARARDAAAGHDPARAAAALAVRCGAVHAAEPARLPIPPRRARLAHRPREVPLRPPWKRL